jgi:DNA replication and repair protein RecF
MAETAELYSEPLAVVAAQLLDARREIVAELHGPVAGVYGDLAHQGTVTISYADTSETGDRTGAGLTEFLRDLYRRTLPADLERGRTMVGPHRDDLDIALDSRPARWYASRGEQRSITLALRLAEVRLLDGAVLMLDDVLSELDPERRRRVFDVAAGVQTIVTTTDLEGLPATAKISSTWRVSDGRLEEAG